KLLKKRYAVFNDDGSLAELKGFEVKRRGELKLIKIFQSQIFKVFLEGTTLTECYAAVANVADQWLDILFSKAQGLPDHELFDLITENRSMSKSLEEYGAQKSTSICTARRLAEFLGDQMVKDKGLACKFVISKKPLNMPVSERAVPVAIFSADTATRKQFLRRWLRDNSLEDSDIRSILDWDYYLERFGSVIQKLITIPAAMQGVSNPVPRIQHPDWLSKRVAAAMSTRKQRHLTDVFKPVSKEEHMAKVSAELERSRIEDDMEDFGVVGSGGSLARRKVGVVHSKRKRNGGLAPLTIGQVVERLENMASAPDPSESYGDWLDHSKAVWALKRNLRSLRLKAAENGDVDMVEEPAAGGPGLGQFFTKTHVSLARNVWHVVQWAETDTPGELRAWVWIGAQLHTVRVEIPRILYVTSAVHQAEIANSKYFSEAPSVVLPRTAYGQHMHTYKCVMGEQEYIAHSSRWGSFFAHPGIGGVYETEVTPLDRALIEVGATAWLNGAARRRGAGRSMADVVGLGDLDTLRTVLAVPSGVASQTWNARDMSYALLYHASARDGRHFLAFVSPAGGYAHVCVVNTAQQTAQLQLPNMERLYRESVSAARDSDNIDDSAFTYPESIEFTAQAFATLAAAYRSINSALAKCAGEKRAPTMLVCQSPLAPRELQVRMRAVGDFPTVRMPTHHADRTLPAFDWQRHAGRRLVASLLGASRWVAERISLAQYADIPVGNIPADAPLFLADVFFARKLTLAKHVLWWSPGSRPDIGGRQDDEFNVFSTESAESAVEISVSGSYAAACAEIELRNLAVNTVLKAPLVSEIEGTVGVFGYDAMSSGDAGQTALLDDDVADRTALLGISSDSASHKPGDSKDGVWAGSSSGAIPASTVQLLRSLLRGWCAEIDSSGSPFAALMAEHFFRWLTRPGARLHDPALAQLVRALMRKVFLQLRAECQKLGARLVFGSSDKLILSTGKGSVPAAQATVDFIIKAVLAKPLFERISLTPLQYWTHLVWMDATNFGGIVVQHAGLSDHVEAESSEPRIEMMWSIKDYLPPLAQGQFEVTVAEYIYKLAGFYAQQR
ncbi:DNA polymerase epsilon catalytic subunit, partial [Linderina pennispora]